MQSYYTNKEIAAAAAELGYVKTNKRSKGKYIFSHPKGKNYITHDLDSHNGGFWKMAKTINGLKSKHTRLGTYDKFLNRIGD